MPIMIGFNVERRVSPHVLEPLHVECVTYRDYLELILQNRHDPPLARVFLRIYNHDLCILDIVCNRKHFVIGNTLRLH